MKTANELAHFLSSHPKVRDVYYPGLETYPYYNLALKQMRSYDGSFAPGSILCFILKGRPDEAKKKGIKLIDWLAKNAITYTLAVSLGCVKTLIEHPSSMTHAAIPLEEQLTAGIEPGGIRLSIGLEDIDMLKEEIENGLKKI